jgi:hypothetical protein
VEVRNTKKKKEKQKQRKKENKRKICLLGFNFFL